MTSEKGRHLTESLNRRLGKHASRSPASKPSAKVRSGGEKSLLQDHMPLWARPGYLIRRLHQIQYALFLEECAGYDITPVQYGLLTALSTSPDIDQNTLGRELGIDRTNVADVLKRLERRGLVERQRSAEDRRMMLARLTSDGENMVRLMYAPMQKAQLRLLDALPSEERSTLISMLIRLVDANNHLGRTIFQPS